MTNIKKIKSLVLPVLLGGTLMLSVGCSSKPNEEQIRMMEETRQAALAAEQKLNDTQAMHQQKESDLSSAEAKVQDCNDKSAATAERLKAFE